MAEHKHVTKRAWYRTPLYLTFLFLGILLTASLYTPELRPFLTSLINFWTIIGSVLDAYVPHQIFQQYLGPSILGLITTLFIATIIEVCSEGSAPIAFSIYKQVHLEMPSSF